MDAVDFWRGNLAEGSLGVFLGLQDLMAEDLNCQRTSRAYVEHILAHTALRCRRAYVLSLCFSSFLLFSMSNL